MSRTLAELQFEYVSKGIPKALAEMSDEAVARLPKEQARFVARRRAAHESGRAAGRGVPGAQAAGERSRRGARMVQRTQLASRGRSERAARVSDSLDRQKELRRLREQAMRETRGDAIRDPEGAARRRATRRARAQSVSSMPLRLKTNPPKPQSATPAASGGGGGGDKPSWWSRHGQKVKTAGAVSVGAPAAAGAGYVAWRNAR